MRFISSGILFLSLSFGVFASNDSSHRALTDTTGGWNVSAFVKSYFHNSELQRQWAWELMGKQALQGDEIILDFGCGDGKISAEMSRLVPHGSVTGTDISSEMLRFAGIKFPDFAYPNLEFKKSNSLIFDDIPGQNSYDIICSFCVFHQVANPLDALKNLKKHLKSNGRLVCVVPAGRSPAFFEAANEIFAKYQLEAPWKNVPATTALTMRTLEGCSTLLKESGYKIQFLEMVDTPNPFYAKSELVDWMVGNIPANWNIPQLLSFAFFSDLVERMCELDPNIIDREGRLNFKRSRIHVVAVPE